MSRTYAIESAKAWRQMSPVYLDTETTGLGPGDEVIEIAIVSDSGDAIFNSLVRPASAHITNGAQAVHGITEQMVAHAPSLADLWPQICAAVQCHPVIIYNASFDLAMLQRSLRANRIAEDNIPFTNYCAMLLYAVFYGDWDYHRQSYRWWKLDAACRQCGIQQPQDHRALGDAQLARLLVHHMAAQPETEDEYPF